LKEHHRITSPLCRHYPNVSVYNLPSLKKYAETSSTFLLLCPKKPNRDHVEITSEAITSLVLLQSLVAKGQKIAQQAIKTSEGSQRGTQTHTCTLT